MRMRTERAVCHIYDECSLNEAFKVTIINNVILVKLTFYVKFKTDNSTIINIIDKKKTKKYEKTVYCN